MSKNTSRRFWFRSVAFVLIPAHVAISAPAFAEVSAAEVAKAAAAPPPPPEVKVNRTVPKVTPPPLYPEFSLSPTTAEITRARVFGEPLLPVGGEPTLAENDTLARTITTWLRGGDPEATGFFEDFLLRYPSSPWRASLAANLGYVYERHGYFGRAEDKYRVAWELARGGEDRSSKAVADFSVGRLLELHMQFGQVDEIEAVLAKVTRRDVSGPAVDQLSNARAAAWGLRNAHEDAIPSAAVALDRMHALARPGEPRPEAVSRIKASHSGASLDLVEAIAREIELPLEAAVRPRGAELITPAIVHLKRGHFATIVREENGRVVLDDPLLGGELWMSREALEEEASGYFLVPGGPLPAGWTRPTRERVSNVRGKCVWIEPLPKPDCRPKPGICCVPKQGGSGGGGNGGGGNCGGKPCRMAEYSFNNLHAGLDITDSPVGYSPAIGPSVEFKVNYSQRGGTQPTTFSYVNFGSAWAPEWVAYVEDDPANPNAPAAVVGGGGKSPYYGFAGGQYAPNPDSHTVLVRTSTSPVRYERRMSDDSVEIFEVADGAATFPRRVFMTQWIDPQGNGVTFSYDAQLRLVAVTDAVGLVSTLSYDLVTDPLKVTRISDPFGRTAKFAYTADGHLQSITDVIGIVSSFEYNGDFVRTLTTPYGVTTFNTVFYYDPLGHSPGQWIEAKDPLGGMERSELAWSTPMIPNSDPASVVPTGFAPSNTALSGWNTFYWDKRAMALHPGDPTKALTTKWMQTESFKLGPYKHSEKLPLENRVWYGYAGNPAVGWVGQERQPSAIARVLDDGSSQIYRYEYNALGNVIRAIDPVGRETVNVYGTGSTPDPMPSTGSSMDLLLVKQKNPGSPGGWDVLQSASYNANHQPLTSVDIAGQVTTNTYLADGRIQAVVSPPRNGPDGNPLTLAERTTTYTYYPDNDIPSQRKRLQTVTDAFTAQGSPSTTYTYDSYVRVRTVADQEGYSVTRDYDALDRLTKVTYPDGTFEETGYNRLDAERHRDRLGRWSHTFHDALRRVVSTRDPEGRTTTYEWCTCGSMDRMLDGNGNTTSWQHDVQGRVTREVRADNAAWEYTYETTAGRLKQRKDPKNQITTYTYLNDNNLSLIDYTNEVISTPSVSYLYDPNYNRVSSMQDGAGSTAYGYHPIATPPALGAGQLASIDGPLANDTITYEYDELGRLITRRLNGAANEVTMAYDALSRVVRETNLLGTFTFGFQAATGRLASVAYPNGQTTTLTYLGNTGDHRLQDIHHQVAGGATLSRHTYATLPVGQISSWTQQVDAVAPTIYEYGYDRADQLTSATLKTTVGSPTVLKSFGYAYDQASNRTTDAIDTAVVQATYDSRNRLLQHQVGGSLRFAGTVNEPAAVTVAGQPAEVTADNRFAESTSVPTGTNAVSVVATDPAGNVRTQNYQVSVTGTGASFTHDANGNLTGDGVRTFDWDAENRLTRVLVGGNEAARFVYDAHGRRRQKIVGSTTRSYVIEGDHVAEERLSGGSTGTIRYFHGAGTDDWLGQQEIDGTSRYLVADHLGSVVRQTNTAGQPTLTRTYDPWGTLDPASSTISGPAYTGREWDAEIGLYYYRARYYDPKIGRFVSEDPIGYEGGMNLFGYVANRPLVSVDPYGDQPAPPGQDVKTRGKKPVPDTPLCRLFGCSDDETDDDVKNRKAWGDVLCQEFAFGTRCAYSVSTGAPPPSKFPPTYVGGIPTDGPDRLNELDRFAKRFEKDCAASAPQGKSRVGTCKRVNSQFVCACCEKCSQ